MRNAPRIEGREGTTKSSRCLERGGGDSQSRGRSRIQKVQNRRESPPTHRTTYPRFFFFDISSGIPNTFLSFPSLSFPSAVGQQVMNSCGFSSSFDRTNGRTEKNPFSVGLSPLSSLPTFFLLPFSPFPFNAFRWSGSRAGWKGIEQCFLLFPVPTQT